MAGENALPCFSPGHVDSVALERIVYNTQAWAPPLQVPLTLSACLHECLGNLWKCCRDWAGCPCVGSLLSSSTPLCEETPHLIVLSEKLIMQFL